MQVIFLQIVKGIFIYLIDWYSIYGTSFSRIGMQIYCCIAEQFYGIVKHT